MEAPSSSDLWSNQETAYQGSSFSYVQRKLTIINSGFLTKLNCKLVILYFFAKLLETAIDLFCNYFI